MKYLFLHCTADLYGASRMMLRTINKLVEDSQLPALFFKFSRKKCEQMCRYVKVSLVDHEELHQINSTFSKIMLKYKDKYEHLGQYQDVYKQIQKGVAYHHSGMLPILKEIVEILFSRGLIKVLFATETFAIGVNMPTKTVIFSDFMIIFLAKQLVRVPVGWTGAQYCRLLMI